MTASFNIQQTDRAPNFDLWLDGVRYPVFEYLLDFEFAFGHGGDWKAKITLFDHHWTTLLHVADALMSSRGEVLFQFGWNDYMSPVYETYLVRYTPDFEHEGITIIMEMGHAIVQKKNLSVWKGSWAAQTKPSTIARQIAQKMGFPAADIIIEESEPWSVPIILDHRPPLTWLTEQFCNASAKKPVTSADGLHTGYIFNIDGGGREGGIKGRRGKFHFHSRDYDRREVSRSYIYAQDIKGQVISFAPTDNSVLWMMYGGSASMADSSDIRKKTPTEAGKSYHGNEGAAFKKGTVETASGPVGPADPTPKKAKRALKDVAHDPKMLEKKAAARWEHASKIPYQASLELLGDPLIDINEYVRVTVLTHQGKPFPLSGAFRVLGVAHKLSPDDFTTSLSLARETNPEGKKEDIVSTRSVNLSAADETGKTGEVREAQSIGT